MDSLFPGMDVAPNVHPLFVHFPLALWLVALLFLTLGAARGKDQLFVFGRWLLYLGTLGAVFAVATGYWATDQMGHDAPGHEMVHGHRDFMVVASLIALAISAAAFFARKRSSSVIRWILIGALSANMAVVLLGADRGAELVYGYGIGTAGLDPPSTDGHDHSHGDVDDGGHMGETPGHDTHEHPLEADEHAAHEHGGAIEQDVMEPEAVEPEAESNHHREQGHEEHGHDEH